ncbi:hypothetical protein COCOBI_19-2320 [Coccomyxa sp. Obi]|nr:hypothetical protein COCOBI_19-2320 [Coccomyxa sp. Obi]
MTGTPDVTGGSSWLDVTAQEGSLEPPITQENILKRLLNTLYSHEDRDAAITAAFKAVVSLHKGEEDPGKEENLGEALLHLDKSISNASQPLRRAASEGYGDLPACEPQAISSSSTAEGVKSTARSAPAFQLSDFPACKRLVDAYRKIFRIPNKTPLSVLYEYASRLNLTVSNMHGPVKQWKVSGHYHFVGLNIHLGTAFCCWGLPTLSCCKPPPSNLLEQQVALVFEEMQEGAGPGPFVLRTMLKDADGATLYQPGVGVARAKKDAKQLAAAALLEQLLETVPFQDLLYKSEKQQQLKDLQVSRMRWSAGRGQGLAARLGSRPGQVTGQPPRGLPPLFAASMNASSVPSGMPVAAHDSLPNAPSSSTGLLPGAVRNSGEQVHFAVSRAQHGRFVSGMRGQTIPYQPTGAASVPGAAGAPYLGNPQGTDHQQLQMSARFGMHRDARSGDDFGGSEAGSSMGNIGGGNVSMLDASMAAITFSGPQQQQQEQQQPPPQQQLVDMGRTGFLPQGFPAPGFNTVPGGLGGEYSEGVYLGPQQYPGHPAALEDLLQCWPQNPPGPF